MAPLLQVNNLYIHIQKGKDKLLAVEDMSFSLDYGGTLGIVGESGCGKSITCLALTRLCADAISITGGEVLFEGNSLLGLNNREFRALRRGAFSMIFQDSIAGLNPLIKAGAQIAEALEYLKLSRDQVKKRVLGLIEKVGLENPAMVADKYPHQMSGGQRQRIMIAISLAAEPKLLIADEPTTALDVTTQLQILKLLRDLQAETGMGLIMISHDVGVIKEMCENVAVMYSGQIVEAGVTKDVFADPKHPYTIGLIKSASCAKFKGELLHSIPGTVAPLEKRQYITGCVFADRCDVRCERSQQPAPTTTLAGGRVVRCHSLLEGSGTGA